MAAKPVMTAAALAAALAGVSPAFAFAPGTFYIRNASQTPMLCGLDVTRGGAYYRFTLRPGQAFRQTLRNDRARELACSTNRYNRTGFRVRAGVTYELFETGNGDLRLRTVDSNSS